MHVCTFLSKKYSAMQNSETNYGLEEAGMAQMDDSIGALLKQLDDIGEANNTIIIFTTDNGAEVLTWPVGAGRVQNHRLAQMVARPMKFLPCRAASETAASPDRLAPHHDGCGGQSRT